MTLRVRDGLPANGVVAVISDAGDSLWFGSNARDSSTSTRTSSARRLPIGPTSRTSPCTTVPTALPASRSISGTTGRVVRASDGRLWFVTARGVTIVDPQRTAAAAAAVAGSHRRGRCRRAAGARSSAAWRFRRGRDASRSTTRSPNLTSPLKTRFRYRWTGSTRTGSMPARGARCSTPICRRALPVPAAGQRRRTAAGRSPRRSGLFRSTPMFYQTIWFYTLCVFGLAAGVWGAWRLRLAPDPASSSRCSSANALG